MIITTPRTRLPDEVRNALDRILDYLWSEEERSFEAAPSDDHIFHSLSVLRAWLAYTEKAPARFELGAFFITVGAREELEVDDVINALARHARGDWGDVGDEDKQSNDFALGKSLRLFSVYHTKQQQKFWVITEADRSATTVLLPSEY